MMKDKLIILGAGVMQGPALRLARNMGLYTIACDGNPEAVNAGLADRFEPIDLKDKEKILELARLLKDKGGKLGIMTAGTDFSASAAFVSEGLGLPGHCCAAALNASDKARMRQRFKEEGVPSPDFIITSANEIGASSFFDSPLIKTAFHNGAVLVVKPCDNMGGRGCSRVESETELIAAVKDAVKFSRTGRAIIEEFMDGPEFSIDAIVHNGKVYECGFADRHIFYPPFFIEMGHTIPSAISGGDKAALLDCFERGVRALKLTEGAAKGDIKLTKKGPMIGEIAARLSGGYMSGWTFPYSSGFEVTKAAIEIAMGIPPVLDKPRLNWTSAERAFISIPGVISQIYGVDEARKMPFVKEVFMRAESGSAAVFPRNNVEKCGNVITAAPSRAEAACACENAVRSILIRLKPNCAETSAFLAQPLDTPYPPSAFVEDSACDYHGRDFAETLQLVKKLSGKQPPAESEAPGFWKAFRRGGYQGALYWLDSER